MPTTPTTMVFSAAACLLSATTTTGSAASNRLAIKRKQRRDATPKESSSLATGLTQVLRPEGDSGIAERGVTCTNTGGWELGIVERRARMEAKSMGISGWGAGPPTTAISAAPGSHFANVVTTFFGDLEANGGSGGVMKARGSTETPSLAPYYGMPGNGSSSNSASSVPSAAPKVFDLLPDRATSLEMVNDVTLNAWEVREKAPTHVW